MRTRLLILQGARRLMAAWSIPLFVLCSCSTDDGLSENAGSPRQLAFSISTEGYDGGVTRGTPMNSVSGTAGLIGFEFNTDWDMDDSKTYLMYNEVMQGSGEVWKTSKSYLPDATKKKRFYAYYPYQTDVDSETAMIRFNEGAGSASTIIPYFDYTTPATAAEQKDLMFAVSGDVDYDENGVLQPIPLVFHHLLAALRITVTNGFDNGTIKRVSLSKIHNKCRFEYYRQVWGELEQDATTVAQDVEVKVSTLNTDVLPLTGGTQYFMLLPQKLEQTSVLTLVYNNGNQDFTLTYNLGKARVMVDDGNGGTVAQPLTFQQGKITTLNITVESVTKMSVRCSLTDWVSGAVFGGDDADQLLILLDSTPGDDDEGSFPDWEDYTGDDPSTGDSTETDVTTGPQ